MGDAPLAVLVVVGILAFIIGLSVLKAVMSRGFDKVFDFGLKTVNKGRNDEVAQVVAVPLVMKSPASVTEIAAALDAIVNAKKGAPGFGVVLYESARTDGKITYAMGNQFYPQQLVAEVRFGERDGLTQVVFKVVHLPEKNGMYAAADPMMLLRESVECAVNAVGDSDKIAEGVRLYGPPEPGSPRAIANRNKMILVWAGVALISVALFKFADGVYMREIPLWFLVGSAGGGLIWLARRMEQRRLSGRADDTASASPVADTLAAVSRLSSRSKALLIVVVAAVVLIVGGLKISHSVQATWDHKLEGDYAQREVEGIAQMEREALEAEQEIPVTAETAPLSPDSHARMEDDLYNSAPSNGSLEIVEVVYAGGEYDPSDSMLSIELTVVNRDPAEWYIMYLADVPASFVDNQEVSIEEFLEAANSGDGIGGWVSFTQERVVGVYATYQGDGSAPAISSSGDSQMVGVPDYAQLGLTQDQWDSMEWGDALEANIDLIEKGFANVGLVATVEYRPYAEVEEATQEPRSGTSVPEGTKVYITIPVAD